MALVFHSGFETGNLIEWPTTAGTISASTLQKNTGGSYSVVCQCASQNRYVYAGINFLRSSFWIYVSTRPNVEEFLVGLGSNQNLRMDAAGHILWYDHTTLVATSAVISTAQWVRIATALTASAYKAYLWINGVVDSNINGISVSDNTMGSYFGIINGAAATGLWYLDDIVLDGATGNTDIGDLRVDLSAPAAAGDLTQMTPSSGANYTDVNEVPFSDTKYVSHAATAEDLYGIQSVATLGISGTVQAVNILMRAKYTTSATAAIQVKDNGTDNATAVTLTASAAWYKKYYATLPTGGGTWTNARFNALQIGGKVSAGTMTIYEEYASVCYLYSAGTAAKKRVNRNYDLTKMNYSGKYRKY